MSSVYSRSLGQRLDGIEDAQAWIVLAGQDWEVIDEPPSAVAAPMLPVAPVQPVAPMPPVEQVDESEPV